MDLNELWSVQRLQQIELGLDSSLGELRRRQAYEDLVVQLFEETSDLARLFPVHKRHLLEARWPERREVALAVVDVVKTALALALLSDLSSKEFAVAFREKTDAVSQYHRQQKIRLSRDTWLACFDLDDVIVDLSDWWRQTDHLTKGLSPDEAWAAREHWMASRYASGAFRDVPLMPGAAEGLRAIRDLGFRIAIITARPQWQYKHIQSDTVASLDEHGVVYDLLLFNRNKVEALYEHLSPAWPACFVEDRVKNLVALDDVRVPILVFDRPCNQNALEGSPRARDWGEVVQHFQRLAASATKELP